MPTTIEILSKFYREVWTERNLDRIEQFFTPNSKTPIQIQSRVLDVNEIREWMEIFHSTVKNIEFRTIHVVENGDWASALMEITCKDTDTNKPVRFLHSVMARQENGRLAESYPQTDFLRFFGQLGRLPPDAYELLMGDNSLS